MHVDLAGVAHVQLFSFGCGIDDVVDHAFGAHARQHHQLTLFRALGAFDGVGVGRVLRQASQHGALGYRQGADGFAKVGACGLAKTVGARTQVDLVHVELKDLVLAQLLLNAQRQQRLFELARQGALTGQKEGAGHLLCDGGGALGAAPRDVGHDGAQHANHINAGMLVKARIFDRQQAVTHQFGELFDAQILALFLAKATNLDTV